MKFWKILFALSIGIFCGLTNAQEESLYGCIYTCGRVGTTTDASSICAATHITINLDARITNERAARDSCRNADSTGYESARKFCTEGIRRCNAPSSDSAIVILNRRITEEERKLMNTNY